MMFDVGLFPVELNRNIRPLEIDSFLAKNSIRNSEW